MLEGAHQLLGLSDLSNSLVTQGFGLWLLVFASVLAFVLASGRFGRAARKVGISRG